MQDVTLIVLFNHNFERNLEVLDKIYRNRFSSIFYIMPFYSGSRPDVISVYDNSFYFEGYIASALSALKNNGSNHYLIIGDDVILHPEIDEHTYSSWFGVGRDDAFISYMFGLHDKSETRPFRRIPPVWTHIRSALDLPEKLAGLEFGRYLPDWQEAFSRLEKHGFVFQKKIPAAILTGRPGSKRVDASFFKSKLSQLKLWVSNFRYIFFKNIVNYPLVGGYSDVVLIPRKNIETFINACGAFGGMNLFVEMAVPTAMCLAFDRIATESDGAVKGMTMWDQDEIRRFEEQHERRLDLLWRNFSPDTLYIHPVKVSKWQTDS